jgi:hypothetical protein
LNLFLTTPHVVPYWISVCLYNSSWIFLGLFCMDTPWIFFCLFFPFHAHMLL